MGSRFSKRSVILISTVIPAGISYVVPVIPTSPHHGARHRATSRHRAPAISHFHCDERATLSLKSRYEDCVRIKIYTYNPVTLGPTLPYSPVRRCPRFVPWISFSVGKKNVAGCTCRGAPQCADHHHPSACSPSHAPPILDPDTETDTAQGRGVTEAQELGARADAEGPCEP